MNIDNYRNILDKLSPYGAKLIVVSKYKSFDEIETVKNWGQNIFGENRVQELVAKNELHGINLEWHLIGSLQKNKVKSIIPIVKLIHSVDSLLLLQEINKQAEKHEIVQDCLLQIKIAKEDTKQGILPSELKVFLSDETFGEMKNIQIRGLMGMATNTEDIQQIRSEFKQLRILFEEIKSAYFYDSPLFSEISAGMSDDFPIALDEGSTLVRIGSLIFNP
ncbi:MAG: YggS family pyridoxal phosphate-dependent enzyme [Saprospiraceae bacterium]|nr:YggS family pyridoxal phosphate-dependent enzyme [Saprospiraceae bacterium]